MNTALTAFISALLASGITAVAVPALSPTPEGSSVDAARPSDASGAVSPSAVGPSSSSPEGAAALAQIEELKMEIASLRSLVQSNTTRRVASLDEEELEGERAAAALLPDEASRDMILAVLEQKEEDERTARREERLARTEERMLERADEIAAELGLNRGDRDALHSILVEESTRRTEVFEAMRENGFGGREEIRTQMQELGDWKTGELTSRFGEDLAGQIDERTTDRGRGGRGGGNNAGGGNTGGGGNNGGGGGNGRGGGGGGRGGN